MRYLIIALLAYLAVACQTTVVQTIEIARHGPDLPAMVAVAVVLLFRRNGALLLVAAVGLLHDALWPGRMGIAMACYLLFGWGLLEVNDRFDMRPLNRRVVATGSFAGLLAMAIGTTRLLIGEPTVGFLTIVTCAAATAAYTAAVAVPFWMILGWSETALNRHQAHYEPY